MKDSIDSRFFEFQKMRAFLQNGVGIHVGNFRHVGIQPAQDYVNSMLLIDLFGIVDEALLIIFQKEGLSLSIKLEVRMAALNERGLLVNAPYLKWYKEWRNDVAHLGRRIDYSELSQACVDVQKQLVFWGLVSDFEFKHYYNEVNIDQVLIGSRIDDIPILVYTIQYINQPLGKSPSWNITRNLTLDDFVDMRSKL